MELATSCVIGSNMIEKITVTRELLTQLLGEAFNEGWYGQLGERVGVVNNIINKHLPKKTPTMSAEDVEGILAVFGDKHPTYFSTSSNKLGPKPVEKLGPPQLKTKAIKTPKPEPLYVEINPHNIQSGGFEFNIEDNSFDNL